MLKVIAEDSDPIAPRSNTTMVYITIIDQNDNKPNFMNSRVTIHVMEDVPLGFSVANVSDGGGDDEDDDDSDGDDDDDDDDGDDDDVDDDDDGDDEDVDDDDDGDDDNDYCGGDAVGDDDNYSMVMLVIMIYVSNTDSIPLDHSRGPG